MMVTRNDVVYAASFNLFNLLKILSILSGA